MSFPSVNIKTLLLLPASLVFLSLVSCGGDENEEEKNVSISISPSQPSVIEADSSDFLPQDYFLVTEGEGTEKTTLTGPWFKFRFSVENGNAPKGTGGIATRLTLLFIKAIIRNGETEKEIFYDPSIWTRCNSESFDNTFNALAGPGVSGSDACGTADGIAAKETYNYSSEEEYLWAEGLPVSQANPENFTYTVEVQFSGFFGSEDEPTNFKKSVFFTTKGF